MQNAQPLTLGLPDRQLRLHRVEPYPALTGTSFEEKQSERTVIYRKCDPAARVYSDLPNAEKSSIFLK